jgi:DNA-binding NtrC family response regulator
MVYGTVKQAGGATTVSSQVGKGTTFTIRFPGVRGTPEVEPFQPQGLFSNRRNSHTILVAEDDKLIQHTLSAALRAAGYDVCTADNGQQALDIFERDHQFIEMVVTDLLMPELSGTDLSSCIHRIKQHLPILYISGYPTDTITDDGVLPDDVEFMQKPFTHREILRKIDDMLHHSNSSETTVS